MVQFDDHDVWVQRRGCCALPDQLRGQLHGDKFGHEVSTYREISDGWLRGIGGVLNSAPAGTDRQSPAVSSSSSTPNDSKGI